MRKSDQILLSTALAVAAAGAATAASQVKTSQYRDTGNGAQQEIVVTGQKLDRDVVYDFVNDVTVDVKGQIAMFQAPICPFADGFAEDQNERVEKRIRLVAEKIGIPTAKEPCSPNVILMVAKDARATLRKLAQKKPILFQGILPTEVRGLLREEGPVWTWQTIEENGSDGRRPPSSKEYKTGSSGPPGGGAGGGAAHSRFEDNAGFLRTTIHSRILKTTRPDLFASYVLIDFRAVEGLTLTQIADYATIRTLARTQAKPTLRQRSILRLLDVPADQRAGLDQLTVWDLAYLQALYNSNNGVSASLQKSSIATAMRRRLGQDGGVPQP